MHPYYQRMVLTVPVIALHSDNFLFNIGTLLIIIVIDIDALSSKVSYLLNILFFI